MGRPTSNSLLYPRIYAQDEGGRPLGEKASNQVTLNCRANKRSAIASPLSTHRVNLRRDGSSFRELLGT